METVGVSKSQPTLLENIMKYLLIFVIFAFSRDTLYSYAVFDFYTTLIFQCFFIGITVLYLLAEHKSIKILEHLNALFYMTVYYLALLISSLIKQDVTMYLLSIGFYFFICYIVVRIFSLEEFMEKYVNIMIFLAIASIIALYVLKPLVVNDTLMASTVTNSANLEFLDFKIAFAVNKAYYTRNFGIFREPGVYGVFLSVALIFEMLVKKKGKLWKSAILLATILTTFSVPAILLGLMILVIKLIKDVSDKGVSKKGIIIVALGLMLSIAIVVVACVVDKDIYVTIEQMAKKMITRNHSTNSRMTALIKDADLFIHSPIWGNTFEYTLTTNSYGIYSIATSTGLLAIFGLMGGLFHIHSIWLTTAVISHKKILRLLSMCGILLVFNTQFLLGNPIFWMISFLSFMDSKNERREQFDLWKVLKKRFAKSNKEERNEVI